jgi:hypothetical protein
MWPLSCTSQSPGVMGPTEPPIDGKGSHTSAVAPTGTLTFKSTAQLALPVPPTPPLCCSRRRQLDDNIPWGVCTAVRAHESCSDEPMSAGATSHTPDAEPDPAARRIPPTAWKMNTDGEAYITWLRESILIHTRSLEVRVVQLPDGGGWLRVAAPLDLEAEGRVVCPQQ